ncbi:hypothetical protein AALP_AA6G047400 [Arabis alpina]|uniref:FeoB-associated Cys-rich membrane protein n=1 Tax=Arabis alpina TaxID=50452 RepID=A0A087GM39_ARAAL|nr:hypothetical protein AALP_AA6G047400 [Arabis alpina]
MNNLFHSLLVFATFLGLLWKIHRAFRRASPIGDGCVCGGELCLSSP